MLNNAFPVCNALPACIAAPPGGTTPPVEGNARFAHALGLAESQQRAASKPAADSTDAPEAPSGQAAATDADAARPRPVRAARAAVVQAQELVADAPRGARHLQDAAADTSTQRHQSEDEDAERSAAPTPIDLATLLPGLALQPAPTSARPTQRALPAGADASAAPGRAAAHDRNAPHGDAGADAVGKLVQALHAVLPGAVPAAGAAAAALLHASAVAQAGTLLASAVAPTAALAVESIGTSLAQLREDTRREPAGEPALPVPAAGTPAAALLPGAAAHAANTQAVFQAELHAALGSPEFAPALGAQLSTLVHDGIAHAQLHLNPAEMGPIAVRISLDGNNAQVDFSAAQAATRQALEDSVPALASALRESGLTLTGGGVFQQPRDARGTPQRPSTRGPEPARIGALDALDAPGVGPALPTPGRARGVLDLFA